MKPRERERRVWCHSQREEEAEREGHFQQQGAEANLYNVIINSDSQPLAFTLFHSSPVFYHFRYTKS